MTASRTTPPIPLVAGELEDVFDAHWSAVCCPIRGTSGRHATGTG